jgi:hypothetical protein
LPLLTFFLFLPLVVVDAFLPRRRMVLDSKFLHFQTQSQETLWRMSMATHRARGLFLLHFVPLYSVPAVIPDLLPLPCLRRQIGGIATGGWPFSILLLSNETLFLSVLEPHVDITQTNLHILEQRGKQPLCQPSPFLLLLHADAISFPVSLFARLQIPETLLHFSLFGRPSTSQGCATCSSPSTIPSVGSVRALLGQYSEDQRDIFECNDQGLGAKCIPWHTQVKYTHSTPCQAQGYKP